MANPIDIEKNEWEALRRYLLDRMCMRVEDRAVYTWTGTDAYRQWEMWTDVASHLNETYPAFLHRAVHRQGRWTLQVRLPSSAHTTAAQSIGPWVECHPAVSVLADEFRVRDRSVRKAMYIHMALAHVLMEVGALYKTTDEVQWKEAIERARTNSLVKVYVRVMVPCEATHEVKADPAFDGWMPKSELDHRRMWHRWQHYDDTSRQLVAARPNAPYHRQRGRTETLEVPGYLSVGDVMDSVQSTFSDDVPQLHVCDRLQGETTLMSRIGSAMASRRYRKADDKPPAVVSSWPVSARMADLVDPREGACNWYVYTALGPELPAHDPTPENSGHPALPRFPCTCPLPSVRADA